MFITFEGIEGSGKSTLLYNVAAAMRRSGLDPLMTREPGGTSLGVALRKVLLDPDMEKIGPIAELMLFAADRAQHVSEVIQPALETGQIVLCDRFSDATVAYQGYGRGIPLDVITSVDEQARSFMVPDMTVLLDLPVETGLGRARTRNDELLNAAESRIDEEEAAFHQRVRDGYLTLASDEPHRFLILDAREKQERLSELAMEEFRMRFPDAF
ncbi:MAG: dTMP kinase [bacterium]|nr:MAG: dTMP kinase [bacterium]